MDKAELKLIIEALLMSNGPLTLNKMLEAFEEENKPNVEQIQAAIHALSEDYKHRAIELKHLPGGYCLQTRMRFSPWIARLLVEKPAKYSRALLETLAIIAYRQPVTRADIEDVRGVAVSTSILKTLLEREWIRIAGHRDVPGKPAVYVTTKGFLDYFNLQSLNDLPTLEQMIHHE
ncbi:SMC-Scp complex subunit ScpB [Legionella septentrionalis]|uniref:SMC-Scp complex subunit ScpB n=1 Tax=Legionella septentrionalis TaxID=2498109 RepID=A0A3S0X1A6_9GAMM|nr:SMC-Scp complex subunit ScpB [Legionella septentrionalis]RUQ89730.1 SMC-Scp complex subunit ScpB [Legionella septentrionalis]